MGRKILTILDMISRDHYAPLLFNFMKGMKINYEHLRDGRRPKKFFLSKIIIKRKA